MINNYKKTARGFTIVELIIAMAVFSFVMVFAVVAFIQINQIYVKGITLKHLNDEARTVLTGLSADIQQESDLALNCDGQMCSSTSSGTNFALCLASIGVSYTWTTQSAGNLKRGFGDVCNANSSLNSAQTLIDSNTSVQYLNVQSVNGLSGVESVDLVLSTQDNSQLSNPGTSSVTCKGTISDQYCGVVHVSTVVKLSGNNS